MNLQPFVFHVAIVFALLGAMACAGWYVALRMRDAIPGWRASGAARRSFWEMTFVMAVIGAVNGIILTLPVAILYAVF